VQKEYPKVFGVYSYSNVGNSLEKTKETQGVTNQKKKRENFNRDLNGGA